jgi:alcohol dehydrogenase class IV
MPRAVFSFPTRVEFGLGSISTLPGHAQRLGTRVLCVTDPGLARLPVFERISALLEAAKLPAVVYSGISPNPLATECERGATVLRESGADVVVGIGGGSALDAAKGIALMATHPGRIVDYDDAKAGYERIRPPIAPVITIPTTSGTGSEVGRSTVVIDDDTRRKVVVFSPLLMPRVAIIDPELCRGLPPGLTAATGFDALTHNLEALVATGFHPMCEAVALEGVVWAARHLERAVREPGDLEAREGMAMAAMMGAVAFQKGLGAAHSLAHPLSSLAGMHHGLANAVVLPFVTRFNQEAARRGYALVEDRLGLRSGVTAWLLALREAVGIPATLAAAGVDRALHDALAAQAVDDACHQSNPRPCTRDDLWELYRQAFLGG